MFPTLEEVTQIAASGDYRMVPAAKELLADRFTPIEVMRTLRAHSDHAFLLESAEQDQRWGRWTFLADSPLLEITCADGRLRIREGYREGHVTETVTECEHPGAAVREVLARFKSPKVEGLPPFTGGLVGYFAYDYIKYAEPTLKLTAPEDRDFLDMDLMLFDTVIAFDHYRQKVLLIGNVDVSGAAEGNDGAASGADTRDGSIARAYADTEARLNELAELLKNGPKYDFPQLVLKEDLTPRFSAEEYGEMVGKARRYIREGDIFQVVLSDPLTAAAEGSLFDTYRVLRSMNPSPYMFYFNSDDVEIAGASPETLVKLEDGVLNTFPLAGTRPRGKTEKEDRELERELLADEKERAEHNMLVDLGRNDIGRIAKLGTVKVDKYMVIERFSHVMHIGSTVSGEIREDRDAVDAVDAILPAGTLSGAPKLRACEIIQELEGVKRGIYGGAIGYLDFTGNLDTCISIRLAYKKNGRVCVQSGAGIVADSVPEKEFIECQNKAGAVVNALRTAAGGVE
ncbi:MAG: chorismate-binding protein [Lachnospiraceae bacterium]|nr:chorismate-binding protein [Lachnospiraceae bacterium]